VVAPTLPEFGRTPDTISLRHGHTSPEPGFEGVRLHEIVQSEPHVASTAEPEPERPIVATAPGVEGPDDSAVDRTGDRARGRRPAHVRAARRRSRVVLGLQALFAARHRPPGPRRPGHGRRGSAAARRSPHFCLGGRDVCAAQRRRVGVLGVAELAVPGRRAALAADPRERPPLAEISGSCARSTAGDISCLCASRSRRWWAVSPAPRSQSIVAARA
jgi:hypothetical protein